MLLSVLNDHTEERFLGIPVYVIKPHASIHFGGSGTLSWFRREKQCALIIPSVNFLVMFCHSHQLNRLVLGL